jgi:hypothetical protein
MLLAYVAGPYRDPRGEYFVGQNIRATADVAVELWRMGYAVLTPHLNTAFFGGACPDDVWLKGDLVMLRRCDLVVLVPGWQKSSGTRGEVAEARACGIPVFEWTAGGLVEVRG